MAERRIYPHHPIVFSATTIHHRYDWEFAGESFQFPQIKEQIGGTNKMVLPYCEGLQQGKKHVKDLPPDILLHIFLRLPLNSIGRAKCTCKLWYAMISGPRSVEMQFSHAVKNPGHLYKFNSLEPDMYYVERVSDGIESMKISHGRFVGQPRSAGGLLAVMMPPNKCYICNPIIGEKVIVPMDPYPGGSFEIRWGGFWVFFDHQRIQDCSLWINNCPDPQPDPPDNSLDIILSFDIGSEEFRHWRGPYSGIHDELNHEKFNNLDFGFELVKFGDTAAVFRRQDLHYTIWALRDKVNETWIKEYDIEPLGSPCLTMVWPMGLWMNRDLLLYSQSISSSRPGVRCSGWLTYDPSSRVFKDLSIPFNEETMFERARNIISHVGCLISPRRVAIDT